MKWTEMTQEARDALVHEKVMGLPLEKPCGAYQLIRHHDGRLQCKTCGYLVESEAHMVAASILPYSVSMDAAWEVVEKIKQEGGRNNALFVQWNYHLTYLYGRPNARDTLYDLTPSGVCIAALKAYGVEIELEQLTKG